MDVKAEDELFRTWLNAVSPGIAYTHESRLDGNCGLSYRALLQMLNAAFNEGFMRGDEGRQ